MTEVLQQLANIETALRITLANTPFLYRQASNPGEKFRILIPESREVPSSLFFFLPASNNDPSDSTLEVLHKGSSRRYKLLKETNTGQLSELSQGDIVPNRLCVFRVQPGTANTLVLVNSPVYGDLVASSLTATNLKAITTATMGAGEDEIGLATKADIAQLDLIVQDLNNKVHYGTEDAATFFSDPMVSDGTIYLKLEDI